MQWIRRVFSFYYEGLKNMTVFGRKLWGLIILKAIILVILAYFLMPNILKQFKTDEEKANHVSNNILQNK